MKKIRVIFLSVIIIIFNITNIFANIDEKIFIGEISNTYEGTENAKATIKNLKFQDVNSHWAKEAITKAGAFNMVKGYDRKYLPNNKVSNQEALAFILRMIGLEEQAQAEGNRLKAQAGNNGLLNIWSIGYLSLSRNMGLINNEQYNQAISKNPEALPQGAFKRDDNVSREQIATWLVNALNSVRGEPLVMGNQQNIYNFSDWKDISSEHINSVEILLKNGVMNGLKNGKFNPKGSLTRAEMAQILSNSDEIYNKIFNLTKKMGTVGGIKDIQTKQTGKAILERNIYVRTSDGKIDVFKYYVDAGFLPKGLQKDTVVFNSNAVTGLASLKEGSQIEYIFDNQNNELKFVSVKNKFVNKKEISGKLNKVDYVNETIQITDNKGKIFNFYLVDGIIGSDGNNNYFYIDGRKIAEKNIPFGATIKLETQNDIVSKITYFGNSNLTKETRGVVTENNVEFSYIKLIDNNGKEITKNYFKDEIEVEKQKHYNLQDDIGYLDQMFPNFNYDPRDSTIEQIEAGDIVFITSREDDPNLIEKISASPNYFMKYGKVNNIATDGILYEILLEFENGQTNWYKFPKSTFISKGGKPVNISEISSGDWVKMLVNEAILAPGETMESVKEIIIEESGHLIGDIIKGQIGSLNSIQNEISIQNSYVLGKNGWDDFKQIRKLSLSNKNIQYYYNEKRVDLPFVEKYLKRASGEAYIAMEKNYGGNLISKITFRVGRDEILQPDLVINTNGVGSFTLAGGGILKTDVGTIVRKNGKLINNTDIKVNDYARVSLNEDGKAAIVDIYEAPVIGAVNIIRGRVKEISKGNYFVVSSISQLNGNSWDYSPIERKFTIDGNTLFITESGIKDINEFIGYSDKTSIDKAFTIVYEGGKATHIIDAPYPKNVVTGVIYEIDSKKVLLNGGRYLKPDNTFDSISNKDASINVRLQNNTIIIKNNKVVSYTDLEKGDKIRVLTNNLPKIASGMEVVSQIIFVEN